MPARYGYGVRARPPQIDMRAYMPWLERRVVELGGGFESTRFTGLAQAFAADVDAVVNASGLGARELAADERVTPIRGQIVCAPNVIGLEECFVNSGCAGETT